KNNFYREQVESVIWRFASPESNFLVLPAGAHIRDEGVVDITHESLIRKWTTLGGWAEAEAESAKWYQSLVRCAELYEAGTGGLWRDPELKGALLRSRHDQWNQAWADQYCPGFEAATKFLKKSKARQTRNRILVRAAIVFLIVAAAAGYAKYRYDIYRDHVNELNLRKEIEVTAIKQAETYNNVRQL